MSQIQTFRIELTPLDTFFFGGEKTFGINRNTDYLIRSERFPQQTSLLGMLRKTLLEQCGLLGPPDWEISDRNAAAKLIGEKSFHLNDSDHEIDFGAIHALSPLFLMKKDIRWFPAPLDHDHTLGSVPGDALIANAGGRTRPIPILHGYDSKKGLQKKWISEEGETVAEDTIFTESVRPGVWKNLKRNGQNGESAAEEEGYFKEHFLKFDGRWRFAFYAELDAEILKCDITGHSISELQSMLVTLGKERSTFRLEATPEEQPLDECFFPGQIKVVQKIGDLAKIVLLSDHYTDTSVYSPCFFALTGVKDFRFIHTTVSETEEYANLNRNKRPGKQPWKSSKYNLLQAGSALYVPPEKLDEVLKKLHHPRFRQIGFNWHGVMQTEFKLPSKP